jgi:hypothetical protein
MELLVKPEILTSYIYIYIYIYIYGLTVGNSESRFFLFAAQRFNTDQCSSYPVAQLCVNTLLATKVTLITHEI